MCQTSYSLALRTSMMRAPSQLLGKSVENQADEVPAQDVAPTNPIMLAASFAEPNGGA